MNGQTVSKGLATWAGLIAAAGQYAGAVAVFLNDPDKATALGPLTTATATLLAVILGRMSQAKALAAKPAESRLTFEPVREVSGAGYTAGGETATRPRPSVDVGIGMPPIDVPRRSPESYRDDFSDEVPGGGVPPEVAS